LRLVYKGGRVGEYIGGGVFKGGVLRGQFSFKFLLKAISKEMYID